MNTVLLQVIANVFNFALFAFILVKFAVPAVRRMIRDRHAALCESVTAVEEANRKASAALDATRQRLTGVDAELAQVLTQAKSIAAQQGASLAAAAREDAERLKAHATVEIDRERQAAVEEIRALVLNQAFERAQRELSEQMNADRQRELVAGLIQKVGDGSLALK